MIWLAYTRGSTNLHFVHSVSAGCCQVISYSRVLSRWGHIWLILFLLQTKVTTQVRRCLTNSCACCYCRTGSHCPIIKRFYCRHLHSCLIRCCHWHCSTDLLLGQYTWQHCLAWLGKQKSNDGLHFYKAYPVLWNCGMSIGRLMMIFSKLFGFMKKYRSVVSSYPRSTQLSN